MCGVGRGAVKFQCFLMFCFHRLGILVCTLVFKSLDRVCVVQMFITYITFIDFIVSQEITRLSHLY